MQLAIDMARRASGQTDINPVVGCVVVNNGRIVGVGAHLKRGEGHAEVHALTMAGEQAVGATAYVTLEPCSHYGQTPPCALRLIESRVARVVVATQDPNPLVAGRGIQALRDAGISVDVGILEQQSRAMNEKFNHFITKRRPFITLKMAMTLDGRIATKTGDSRFVSGAAAREYTHTLRHQHRGIMIGVGTALADDPQLTTRLSVPAIDPVRIVVDSKLRLSPTAKMLQDGGPQVFILTVSSASGEAREKLAAAGANVLTCGDGPQVDLQVAMQLLGEYNIGSILLEGGGQLAGAMIEAQLVDKIVLYIAPKLVGGFQAPLAFAYGGVDKMDDALTLRGMHVEQLGDDWCVIGYPEYKEVTIACLQG